MLKLGEILFRMRDYTPIPFVIVMIIYPSVNQTSLLAGTLLMLFGEIIRVKGVAHIGGVSRTKTYSTGRKLITSGLFSHVRNPLYIGNFFLSVGIVVVSNVHPYFTAFFIAFFFMQYIPIVNWEESNLKNVFGKEFEDYISKVPRWIPSFSDKIGNKEAVKPDYKKAIKSEKNTLVAIVILYIVVLWRSGWFFPVMEWIKSFS
ncbi:MAG: isoprenylcysteine carboxylmethyltransferase family protein [Proteobacteria bacterium]|nr:isoprenylcysteine carboxylmethyltransferase family protein [Pseudomonadota bacterium]